MTYKICEPFDLPDNFVAEIRKHAEKHALELGKSELGKRIGQVMRAVCPVPGNTWDRLITVILPLKGCPEVPAHAHKRHLILYYPEACEPVVIESDEITPTRGMMIYVPPETSHYVPPVTKTRLSVAMLVSESGAGR